MSVGVIILVVALIGGLYMAWMIGANDVANAMGTSVGSGALTLLAAIALAAVLEFAGAVLLGSSVTETISKGIVEISLFEATGPWGEDGPVLLALGMLCALLGSAVWLHLATHLGLPVSTTHSIAATKRFAPYLVAVTTAVMVLSFIYKALKNRWEAPPVLLAVGAAAGVGVVVGVLAGAFLRNSTTARFTNPYDYVERMFALLQIATACFVAFAHGANDVANAVGPLAAVVSLYRTGYAEVATTVGVPFWILVLGGGGIVLGLATLGYKVIATIGREITEITPTRGFCAEFGAATTVLVASSLGLPISTTHTLVGGVIGVGFAQGIGALNLSMVRNIVRSWIATVPVAAGVSALLFVLARAIFL